MHTQMFCSPNLHMHMQMFVHQICICIHKCFVHLTPFIVFKLAAFYFTGYLYTKGVHNNISIFISLIFVGASYMYYRHNRCTSNKKNLFTLKPLVFQVLCGSMIKSIFFLMISIKHLLFLL